MGFFKKLMKGSTGSNDLKSFLNENQYQAPPAPEVTSQPVKGKEMLANEELLNRLQQQIYADRGRLASGNQPIYKGKMISPMSSMTQNARAMREQYANKIPKQGKIASLLQREAKGWTPEQTQGMLNMLKRGENSEQLVLDRLNKQFGKNFGYEAGRGEKLKGKIGKDINQNLEMSKINLKNMGDEIKNLEEERSTKGVKSLQKQSGLKTARREALIKQLEDFGNQEHVLNNMKLQSDRDVFEEEKSAPFRKMAMATRGIGDINPDEMHPDKMQMENQLLQKINNAYNQPHQNYPGQRVVGTEPETEAAFNIAQQINPKYKDVYAGERKAIEQDLLQNTLRDKLYNRIPESVEPLMSNLDALAKRQLKAETKGIGGHYARQGTYGSAAHKAATEATLRDVMRRVQAEREGALLTGAKGQRDLIGQEEATARNRYDLMADEGAKEFGNILQQNERLNKEGWRKRANKQGEENQAMQSWYGQLANEWPVMNQGPSYRNVNMGPFEDLAKGYNTDLNGLFSQPALFSENEKAFNAYQGLENKKIKDYESYLMQNKKSQFDNQQLAQLKARQAREAQETQERANAAARANAAKIKAGAVNPRVQDAWANYDRARNQGRQWLTSQGWRTSAADTVPSGRVDQLFNLLSTGPGLPYQGPTMEQIRAKGGLGVDTSGFPQNMNLSREAFEKNPASIGWADPAYKWS